MKDVTVRTFGIALAALLVPWISCFCDGIIIKEETHRPALILNPETSVNHSDASQLVLSKALARPSSGCYCLNDTCACCEHLDIPRFHINDTGCVEVIYLRKEYGLSLLLLVDGFVLINRTISVHNPPPVCYAVPKVSAANLCVQFFDLHVRNKVLSGCLRIIAAIASHDIMKKDIGCFHFPISYEEAFLARTSHLIQQKDMADNQRIYA